jgi:hypothetical protein
VRREIEPGTTIQAVANPETAERLETRALIVRLPFATA